ncbi:MAG: hypothetical protein MZU95_08700 [Desulfomicrobium escambiense]|nr:hypothetical protein [Desulfomicrobium escambiense]
MDPAIEEAAADLGRGPGGDLPHDHAAADPAGLRGHHVLHLRPGHDRRQHHHLPDLAALVPHDGPGLQLRGEREVRPGQRDVRHPHRHRPCGVRRHSGCCSSRM